MTRVYVSSTYTDLAECRLAVLEALKEARIDFLAMESYAASSATPLAKCLEDLEECDVYVGIVGLRYGFVPTGEQNSERLSITELEYKYAFEVKRIQCLLFLTDDRYRYLATDIAAGAERDCIDRLRSELRTNHVLATFLDPQDLAKKVLAAVMANPNHPARQTWETVRKACAASLPGEDKYPGATTTRYVRRRTVQEPFREFLASEKSAFVVTGASGYGKTTLVARLAADLTARGNLCYFLPSARLPQPADKLERYLISALAGDEVSPSDFWRTIGGECLSRDARLFVFIDALNEYDNAGTDRALAYDFITAVDDLIWRAREQAGRSVRFVITSRPETWRRGEDAERVRPGAYLLNSEGGVRHVLSRFSEDEARLAFGRYSAAHNISTSYDSLSELRRYQLRDPLLLSLACRLFEGGSFPPGLDADELLSLYDEHLRNLGGKRGLRIAIALEQLIDLMFEDNPSGFPARVVKRDQIRLPPSSNQRGDPLDPYGPGSLFFLLDTDIVRLEGDKVRFTYDRYAEHLLTKKLVAQVRRLESTHGLPLATEAVVRANLPNAHRVTVLLGALRRMLRELRADLSVTRRSGSRHGSEYPNLLADLAQTEHGASLVASVVIDMAIDARPSQAGFKELREFFARVCDDIDHAQAQRPILFPIIDATYRMLINDEYQAWLGTQLTAVQNDHLSLLRGVFSWGISHRSEAISRATVQHLFFLWQSREKRDEADRITGQIVSEMKPASKRKLIDETYRRLITNLSALFLLTLANAKSDGGMEVLAPHAHQFVARVRPLTSGIAVKLLLASTLGSYVLKTVLKLPNAVNDKALVAIFEDDDDVRERLHLALVYLAPDAYWEASDVADDFVRLLRSDNGIVLQLAALALSVRYERLKDGATRSVHLTLIGSLFDREANPRAQYCCALAMYHINYFGEGGTKETMDTMGRMVKHVLDKYRGQFATSDGEHNFHVVGTYGRSLRRHSAHCGAQGGEGYRSELQFVLDALADARGQGDFTYYLYLCKNVGLLGILQPPRGVFEVFTHVFKDLRDPRFPFRAHVRQVEGEALASLANIRVLYPAEVDRYVLDTLNNPGYHAEIATRRTPTFSLPEFYSWNAEHLMFRVLTEYYDIIGADVVRAFVEGAHLDDAKRAADLVLRQVVERLETLAARS